MDLETRTRVTFLWDRIRGGANGVVESTWQAFALLVAIRYFDADESVKQFLSSASGMGLLASPFLLAKLSRFQVPISRLMGCFLAITVVAMFFASLATSTLGFIVAVMIAQFATSQTAPLMTQVYSANYPTKERGQRLSTSLLLTGITGMVFGLIAGEILDLDPERVSTFRWVFFIGTVAAFVGMVVVFRIPSEVQERRSVGGMLESFWEAGQDRLFLVMLTAWMFMGYGNLMLIPVRIEYLANTEYGVNASNGEIAVLMAVIIPLFRMLSTKVWGFVFDHMNLITVRIILNSTFLLSNIAFFMADSLWVMGVGAALIGMALGGGGVLWALWVTKVAAPDKVSSYMSLHGATTGFRAMTAPFIGYFFLDQFGPLNTALIASVLITISSLLFLGLREKMLWRQTLTAG